MMASGILVRLLPFLYLACTYGQNKGCHRDGNRVLMDHMSDQTANSSTVEVDINNSSRATIGGE